MKFLKSSLFLLLVLIPVSTAVVSHPAAQIYIDIGGGSQTLQQMFDSGALGQWDNGAGGAIYYNDGNVGIGTSTPARKLTVSDTISSSKTLVPPSGQISTAVQGDAKILLYDFGGENWAGIGTDTGGNVWLRTGTGSDNFLVVGSGGAVGIGTTSPAYKLDIAQGNQARIADAEIGDWPYNNNYAYFGHEALDHGTAGNYALLQSNTGNTFLNAAPDQNIYFRINNVNQMILTNTGNVGIGTTSPSEKLQVSGNVRASGFCIGASCITSWPSGGHGDGSNCNAGYAPLGVDANGNAQGCWDVAAESHNHDSAYVNVGGDTMTGQLTVSINSAEGGSLRLANPGKNADWVFYNMRGGYGESLQIWNYPGGTPTQRFVISDTGNVGIGVYPSIKLALVDADSGLTGNSIGTISIKSNNIDRIAVYGDDTGIRFNRRDGTEMMNIGTYGTSLNGNLIMTGGGYIQFPVRSSPPAECTPSWQGAAYFRTQSPEILCICQGDGSSWHWFGHANGNEIHCAD